MNDAKILEILENNDSPMYVFDLSVLIDRINYLKSNLPSNIKLCYAMKANSFITKTVSEHVDYLEICSPGEYNICEGLNLPRNKYVISGVNKNRTHIESAVSKDDEIYCYTVESVSQYHLLSETAIKFNKKLNVLLRVTSSNQFGLDEEDLMNLVRNHKEDSNLEIIGIQYFTGTQKTSLKKMQRELDYSNKVINRLRDELDFEVQKLEFGTGFPVCYFEEESFDEDEYLKTFSEMIQTMEFKGDITLEIGRSIAASCGSYITKVVDTKCNKNELYAIVDGGINQITYYGQSMAMKHPKISLLPSRDIGETKDWNICGSLCTINDFLVKRMPLTDLKIGDILVFHDAGAYCVTEGISLFLSRELPSVGILNTNGELTIVRNQIPTEIFNTPQNL